MTEKKLEEIEDAGCPYFFDEDCGAKVTEAIYNSYCLDAFKDCPTYKFIQRDGENYIGSRK